MQKLPIWDVLNDKVKSKKKNLISNTALSQEKQPKGIFVCVFIKIEKNAVNKKERQELLKICLRDTMNLTKTLKNQLNILKRKESIIK